MLRLATDRGVVVDVGVEVVSVEGTDASPRVTLADGTVLTPDLVVGADGPTSVVRRTAFDYEENAQLGGVSVLGGMIPADEMLKDPELSKFVLADEVCAVSDTICQ